MVNDFVCAECLEDVRKLCTNDTLKDGNFWFYVSGAARFWPSTNHEKRAEPVSMFEVRELRKGTKAYNLHLDEFIANISV